MLNQESRSSRGLNIFTCNTTSVSLSPCYHIPRLCPVVVLSMGWCCWQAKYSNTILGIISLSYITCLILLCPNHASPCFLWIAGKVAHPWWRRDHRGPIWCVPSLTVWVKEWHPGGRWYGQSSWWGQRWTTSPGHTSVPNLTIGENLLLYSKVRLPPTQISKYALYMSRPTCKQTNWIICYFIFLSVELFFPPH